MTEDQELKWTHMFSFLLSYLLTLEFYFHAFIVIECRKTKTKAIAATNHHKSKPHNEPMKI